MATSRSLGSSSLTARPSILISPDVMSSSPAIMRNRVLLPQPDGHTKTTNSRSATSRSTPCTTATSPYDLQTPWRLTPATVVLRPAACVAVPAPNHSTQPPERRPPSDRAPRAEWDEMEPHAVPSHPIHAHKRSWFHRA